MPLSAESALRRLKLQEERTKGKGKGKEREVRESESETDEEEEEESSEEEVEEEDEEKEKEDTDESEESDDHSNSDKEAAGGSRKESKKVTLSTPATTMQRASAASSGRQSRQETGTSSSSSRPSTGGSGSFLLDSTRAQSGIYYDLSDFAPSARASAEKGLKTNGLQLQSCSEDTVNSHFVLKLKDLDPIKVRIGDPKGKNFAVPSCTCAARPAVHGCKHIFWIADQAEKAKLNQAAQPKLPNGQPKPFRLSKTGAQIDSQSTYSLIGDVGAETFERRCHIPARGGSEDRRRNINYLLSVFEPSGQLPHEFHEQERQTHPDRRSQAYQELRDVIMSRSITDNELYNSIRAIVSQSLYASVIFQKLRKRAKDALRSLDEYIKNGGAGNEPACDVETCANRLEDIVEEIRENLDMYQGENYLEAERIAAVALVEILNGVIIRDYDAYERVTWGRPIDRSEPLENRNLFIRLIARRLPGRDPFLLPALARLPSHTLRMYKDELDQSIGQMEQSSKQYPQIRDVLSQWKNMRSIGRSKRKISSDTPLEQKLKKAG